MKLHFREFGEGPPLLILHGLLGSLDNWLTQAQKLAAHFEVFVPDHRNHGQSPHADEFDYEAMAGDLLEFVNEHQLGTVHLLGHSMGGKTAMRFAQLHPDRVDKLVVVDMSPREYAPRYGEILAAMQALDLAEFERRDQVEVALATVVPDKNLRQFLLKNLRRDTSGALRWKPNLAALRTNYANVRHSLRHTEKFTGPVLFVRGGRSDYLRDEDIDPIQQLFPRATMATIAAAGHWVHAEAPVEFLRVVTEFLLAKK
jgi:esterase